MFRCYCIHNVKNRIKIQIDYLNNESVSHSSHFMSVKVRNYLRNSQAQFREMLRKLCLRQNDGFLIKNMGMNFRMITTTSNIVDVLPLFTYFTHFCPLFSEFLFNCHIKVHDFS